MNAQVWQFSSTSFAPDSAYVVVGVGPRAFRAQWERLEDEGFRVARGVRCTHAKGFFGLLGKHPDGRSRCVFVKVYNP